MSKQPANDYEKFLIESGINPSELAVDDEDEEVVIGGAGSRALSDEIGFTNDGVDSGNGVLKLTPEQLDDKINSEVKGFSDLLDTLSSTEERKKALWRQIYEYALIDRKNAFVLFGDLYTMVAGNGSEHAIHGATLAKYMERMSKANEQLIKLASLVSDAVDEDIEQNWGEDEMYGMMGGTTLASTGSPKSSKKAN